MIYKCLDAATETPFNTTVNTNIKVRSATTPTTAIILLYLLLLLQLLLVLLLRSKRSKCFFCISQGSFNSCSGAFDHLPQQSELVQWTWKYTDGGQMKGKT